VSEESYQGHIGRTIYDSEPGWPSEPEASKGAPNIVVILLDDVGFAQLGCYGSNIETPVIDGLADNGLRFNNFHTTAMCSPTRASLLTGRNHHSAGMGAIVEWSTGFPGYRGELSKRTATLAEILRPHGYNSFAVGKWHLMRMTSATAAGPFDAWPLGRGFDRFYGFLASHADHYHPELYEDNRAIDTPRGEDYHLTEDLADQAISMIRSQKSVKPEKPFFLYFAPGACHSPHQVPKPYIDKYKGRFDAGWDEMRRQWFDRQKELGVVPEGTELTDLNGNVTPWDRLNDKERELCARMQEVYAGFLDHTDEQIGRIFDFLKSIQQYDNTLVMFMSDNGASDEGGEFGNLNIRKHYSFIHESFEELYDALDEYGSEYAYNHYPMGWGHAGNTPLKWFKMDTHGGGIRDPFIVQWPRRISKGGEIRAQFHHVIDVVPTILDYLAIRAPDQVNGVPQTPIHGKSMRGSIEDANAPTPCKTQYFEMLGDRGIWADGWKAVTRHTKGTSFDDDVWELYHVDEDFSEYRDLAAENPGKLQQMIDLWWSEAGKYDVLPLDDRDRERAASSLKAAARKTYRYYPGMMRIDRMNTPNVSNCSHRIEADLEIGDLPANGVILSAGNRFGGYVLYCDQGHLTYAYTFGVRDSTVVRSRNTLPKGRVKVAFDFTKTGEKAGIGQLYIGDSAEGKVDIEGMWPIIPNVAGAHCGRDDGSPVCEDYATPNPFSGRIHHVDVIVGDDQVIDFMSVYNEAVSED
jgi:arylsulfatase